MATKARAVQTRRQQRVYLAVPRPAFDREWRLTDLGIVQAQAAGELISKQVSPAFSRYYTSEYLRAREVAAHLRLPAARCDKIHNGQVLHYTRRDPATGGCSGGLEWVHCCCPWAPARARSGWCRIKPPSFSNEDLLSALATTERLIPGPPVEPDRARAHRPA